MKKSAILAVICLTTVSVLNTSCKKKDATPATPPTTTTPAGPTLYSNAVIGGSTMVQDPAAASGTMIEQGRLTLRSVVDSAIYVIAGDAQINGYFQVLLSEVGGGNTTGFSALSENFTDFLCGATGATNPDYKYGGKSMKDTHDPAYNSRIAMKINATDFDKFVGDIGTALGKFGVTSTSSDPNVVYVYNQLVTTLESLKPTIVQN